jgi:hypothetical protein
MLVKYQLRKKLTMNKYFKNFLKTRKHKEDLNRCNHGDDEWCQNCVNFGEEIAVELPNGQISRGYYKHN